MAFRPLELAPQPDPRELPIAHDRVNRDTDDVRGLFDAQAAKDAKFDDTTSPRIECRQGRERIVKRNEVAAALRRRNERVAQRHSPKAAASLEVPPRARAIDEDVPHEPGGKCEEVRAIPQPHATLQTTALINEAYRRLVEGPRGSSAVHDTRG
jgi:hypothetical protein